MFFVTVGPSSSSGVSTSTPTGTAGRYGEGEPIYEATTGVVRSVMRLSEGVRGHQVEAYVELVRQTGLALRGLLAAVDALPPTVLNPEVLSRRVEPAQHILSADMAALVAAVKLAVQRPADSDQRRSMLEAAHSLAVDAKNLLDIVDSIRSTANLGSSEVTPSFSGVPGPNSVPAKTGVTSGTQTEVATSMFSERSHRSECSSPRSSTPTSFR